MSDKFTIDKEIEQLEESLDSLEDTHPDYIPPELKTLQARVLAGHAHLENGLETRIYLQIKRSLSEVSDDAWENAVGVIRPLLEALSYRNKLGIVESYGDVTPGLIDILKKVNSYRVEFAHPQGMKLRNKYNYTDSQGKQNVRDLLRCLLQAKREMDNYFIKVNGVPKMRERIQ